MALARLSIRGRGKNKSDVSPSYNVPHSPVAAGTPLGHGVVTIKAERRRTKEASKGAPKAPAQPIQLQRVSSKKAKAKQPTPEFVSFPVPPGPGMQHMMPMAPGMVQGPGMQPMMVMMPAGYNCDPSGQGVYGFYGAHQGCLQDIANSVNESLVTGDSGDSDVRVLCANACEDVEEVVGRTFEAVTSAVSSVLPAANHGKKKISKSRPAATLPTTVVAATPHPNSQADLSEKLDEVLKLLKKEKDTEPSGEKAKLEEVLKLLKEKKGKPHKEKVKMDEVMGKLNEKEAQPSGVESMELLKGKGNDSRISEISTDEPQASKEDATEHNQSPDKQKRSWNPLRFLRSFSACNPENACAYATLDSKFKSPEELFAVDLTPEDQQPFVADFSALNNDAAIDSSPTPEPSANKSSPQESSVSDKDTFSSENASISNGVTPRAKNHMSFSTPSSVTMVCAWCRKGGKRDLEFAKKLKLCSGCHNTYYCSRDCQTQDWVSGHAQTCQAPK